jgi:hypothetical protein
VRGITLAVRLFEPESKARGKDQEGGLAGRCFDGFALPLGAFEFWDGLQGHFVGEPFEPELLLVAVFLLVLTGAKLSALNPLGTGAVPSTEVSQRQSEQRGPWHCQCYAQ